MAKLPAMQNQYVEFAKNDSEGNELSKLNTLDSIPVLTKDNALEIFEKKPKSIIYYYEDTPLVYNIQDISLSDYVYYTSVYGTSSYTLDISKEGIIREGYTDIPTETGTKLYKHFIQFGSGGQIYLITADSEPYNSTTHKLPKFNDIINVGPIEYQGGYRQFFFDNGLSKYIINQPSVCYTEHTSNGKWYGELNAVNLTGTTGAIIQYTGSMRGTAYSINTDTVTPL